VTEDNRIRDIRAVVAEIDAIHPLDFRSIPSVGSVIDRIRAILDSAPPAPQVWFPGDVVPAETEVQTGHGNVYRWREDRVLASYFGPVMEVPPTTHDVWQAAVDRAKSARGDVEGRHTEGTNP